jgi:hypothetical protein
MEPANEATIHDRIVEEVTSWPGVEAVDGSRGELAFRLARREIGHIHGGHSLHLGFPKKIWHELHDEGRIDYHPVFPGKPGYAARRIETQDDVLDAIALLRINYDRAIENHGVSGDAMSAAQPSNGDGGIRVWPLTSGMIIANSSGKHHDQSSPGSSERMMA